MELRLLRDIGRGRRGDLRGLGRHVIKYFGKKPSATAIAANDTIFVTVVSATLAHVWISAEIP
ncbi:MAG: hypothetical protein IPK85_01175 [Gemmatimonadetes bacterium]|nr:hypothetical protein [Gemmatimonadota bacterium]